MFTMQNNDSRLQKAARRTLRAEATLIIVILLITTWSVYGLYKLSIGVSDTFLGLNFRSTDQSNLSIETRTASFNNDVSLNNSTQKINSNNDNQRIEIKPIPSVVATNQASESSNHKLVYPQQNEANQIQNILQQLYSVSRNDNHEVGHQNNIKNQINSFDNLRAQVHDQKVNPISLTSLDSNHEDNYRNLRSGYKLPSNLEDLLGQDKRRRVERLHPSTGVDSKPPLNFPSLMQLGAEAARANRDQMRPKTVEPIETKFPDVMPDYNDEGGSSRASDDNLSYDRVPAESKRDSNESVVKSDDMNNQSGSHNNIDEKDNQQDIETTTAQPIHEETEQDKSDSANGQDDPQNSEQQSSVNSDESKENDNEESTRGSDDEASQQPDDESTKETSRSIDEEVDKMTQPTSGMVSQQDRPGDYKNTVQFDDSLPPAVKQSDKKSALKALEPGDLIARFEDPNRRTDQFGEEVVKQRGLHDLQVDHNTKSTGIDTLNRNLERKEGRLKGIVDKDSEGDSEDRNSRNDRRYSKRVNRQKRSVGPIKIENIKAPYEVGKFLDSLNFDSLTGQLSSSDAPSREPKSLDLSLADSRNHSTTVDRYAYNPIPDDETKQSYTNRYRESNKKDLANTNKIDTIERRNLFDDELIGPENNKARKLAANHYYDPDPDVDNNSNQYYQNKTSSSLKTPDKSRYHYLTSSNTGIQELLDKKSLFNSLSDDLPPPAEKPDLPSGPKSLHVNRNQSNRSDHQAEDSLFSVDHGLLLYPSADEEHHHKEKAISKKHKKSDKKKEKKKMTVAIKKGGHKKKKHKKEMKKFLKEKKFKGAKKGKKVAKGKGGQGGKKGKKLYKDKGFKKKGFKNVYHKEEFGQKKSYFDEYRDKDFKKKWKKFDDKYNYAQMKKWQAKDVKAAKKKKDHGEKYKKYDKGKWKKKYEKHSKEHSEKHMKKKKKSHKFK